MGKKKSDSRDNLSLLYKCLGLIPAKNLETIDDVVLVAIDLEYIGHIKQQSTGHDANCQVEVAVLDTKSLVLPFPESPISTCDFIAGSPTYCEKASKRLLFGRAVTIRHSDIRSSLEALTQRERNIVLVGHAFENDLRILRDLGLDLHTSVVATFDTQKIAAEFLPGRPASLCTTLELLGCPFENLQNAGNDAHFTLQALVAAVVKLYSSGAIINVHRQDRVIALKAIMQDPFQEWNNHEGIALKSISQMSLSRLSHHYETCRPIGLKGNAKSRKHQARSWNPETIERLRAERIERKMDREGFPNVAVGQNKMLVQGGESE